MRITFRHNNLAPHSISHGLMSFGGGSSRRRPYSETQRWVWRQKYKAVDRDSATHLLLNGDAASLVFFGGLLVLSAAGPPSIDAKRARKLGDKWQPFAAVTSNIPFQAIASGRNKLALGEIVWWRYLAAAGIWLAAFYFHAALFGVSPHPI